MGKPGWDGRADGATVTTRLLRAAGHEVIYAGLRQAPQRWVTTVSDGVRTARLAEAGA